MRCLYPSAVLKAKDIAVAKTISEQLSDRLQPGPPAQRVCLSPTGARDRPLSDRGVQPIYALPAPLNCLTLVIWHVTAQTLRLALLC